MHLTAVEAPPNVCTPSHLAEAAKHIAALFPSTMKVLCLMSLYGIGKFGSAAGSMVVLMLITFHKCVLVVVPGISHVHRIIARATLICSHLETGSFALQLTVLEKSDCEALGMGMYLGVAEASDEPVGQVA